MRAAVLEDVGRGGTARSLIIKSDVPVPSICEGDVLVRVHASSINPLDNQMRYYHPLFYSSRSFPPISNRFGYARSITGLTIDSPLILGRECSGIVEKAGQNVWNFKVSTYERGGREDV